MREFTPEEIRELLNESLYSWIDGTEPIEQPNGENYWRIKSIVRIDNRTCVVKYYDSTTTAGKISIPSQVPDPVNYEDKTVTNRHWSYADGRGHLVSHKISD